MLGKFGIISALKDWDVIKKAISGFFWGVEGG